MNFAFKIWTLNSNIYSGSHQVSVINLLFFLKCLLIKHIQDQRPNPHSSLWRAYPPFWTFYSGGYENEEQDKWPRVARGKSTAWVCGADDLARVLAQTSCLGNKEEALVRAVQECSLSTVSNSTPDQRSADVKLQDRTCCQKKKLWVWPAAGSHLQTIYWNYYQCDGLSWLMCLVVKAFSFHFWK